MDKNTHISETTEHDPSQGSTYHASDRTEALMEDQEEPMQNEHRIRTAFEVLCRDFGLDPTEALMLLEELFEEEEAERSGSHSHMENPYEE